MKDILDIVKELIRPTVVSTITWTAFAVLVAMMLSGKTLPDRYWTLTEALVFFWVGSSVVNGKGK